MNNKILTMTLIMLLQACSSEMIRTLDIPVATQCPAITVPPKPILPIVQLNEESKPNDVVKAYAMSVKLLEDDDNQLRVLLKGYGGSNG